MCFGRDKISLKDESWIIEEVAMLKHFVLLHNILKQPSITELDDTVSMGMLLPDETYEERRSGSRHSSSPSNSTDNDSIGENDPVDRARALADLKRCDDFLKRHGIRPEFFCRHRERLALQAWLLQRSPSSDLTRSEGKPSSQCMH